VLLDVFTQYDIVVAVDIGKFTGGVYIAIVPATVTLADAVAFTNVIDVPEFTAVTVYVPRSPTGCTVVITIVLPTKIPVELATVNVTDPAVFVNAPVGTAVERELVPIVFVTAD
jgi:hypothetical protein